MADKSDSEKTTGWTEADIESWMKAERRKERRRFWRTADGVNAIGCIGLLVAGALWCLSGWVLSL